MGALFAEDNSAEIAAQNAAAEQRRFEQEQQTQARVRQEQADREAKASADLKTQQDKMAADAAAAKLASEKQAQANLVTGAQQFFDTRTQQANAMAAGQDAGLPGMNKPQPAPTSFANQMNPLVAKPAAAPLPGGRRYV